MAFKFNVLTGKFDLVSPGGITTVKNEGTSLTTSATSIDFVGENVTATNSSGAITVTVSNRHIIFSDDFTDTDNTNLETHNSLWVKNAGGAQGIISGNRATSGVAGNGIVYDYTTALPTQDFTIELDFTCTANTSQYLLQYWRTDLSNNWYRVYIQCTASGYDLKVDKSISGVQSQLGSTYSRSFSGSVTSTIKIVISGSSFKVYEDGTLRVNTSDANLTSGNLQTRVFYGSYIDNFMVYYATIGDVTGPTSSTDNAVARFDATTGKVVQNSGVIIDDSNNTLIPGYTRIGSASAPNNTTAGDITGVRLSIGDQAQSADQVLVGGTINSATNNYRGIRVNTVFTGAGAGDAGIEASPIHRPSSSVSTLYGLINIVKSGPGSGVTITNSYGGAYRADTESTLGIVTNSVAVVALAPTLGSLIPANTKGLLVNNQGVASVGGAIGIDVVAQTAATTTIGIRVAAPTGTTSYALQLSDTGGTAAGGITFGTDVQLYRSAANILKLDDDFRLAGDAARTLDVAQSATTTGANFTLQAGSSVTGGTNEVGGALILKTGAGTGNDASGFMAFYTAAAGASGTTTESVTEKIRITTAPNGVLLLGSTGAQGGIATNDGINMGGATARSIHLTNNTGNNAGSNLGIKAGAAAPASATDKAGGTLILASGQSTGTGSTAVKIQTATTATSTGTAANTLTDRVIVTSPKALTDGSPTNLVSCTIASGSAIGGNIRYTIEVTDGTDYQSESGYVYFTAVNKAGTVTAAITEHNSGQSVSAGTLTTTWAISAASPTVISLNADTSLTASTGYPRITYTVENYGQQAIAIQ